MSLPTPSAVVKLLAELSAELDFVDHGVPVMHPENDTYLARTAFDIGLVLSHASTSPAVIDLGGGIGLFSLGLAALGARSIIADDFGSYPYREQLIDVFSRRGVEVLEVDLLEEDPLPLAPASVDAVTTFHFVEHMHDSPKQLFHQAADLLRPGGIFVIGGPNCVNARKRVTGLIGRNKWSPMEDWYERPKFRGHVREPDLDDLRYIVADLGFERCDVFGRNYLGRARGGFVGKTARLVDPVLQMRPALCSDIYAVGAGPKHGI